MTFVKQQPKPATLSVYRMMSGLTREEESQYLSYFREFIHWLSTDEGTLTRGIFLVHQADMLRVISSVRFYKV